MTVNPSSGLSHPTVAANQILDRPGQLTPVDPLRVFRQYRLLLLLTAVMGFGAGSGLWWVLIEFFPGYTSEAQLLVGEGVDEPTQGPTDPGSMDQTKKEAMLAYIENQILALYSVNLQADAISLPTVRQTRWYKSFATPTDALEAMQDNLRCQRLRDSTTIRVSFTGSNMQDPPLILDAVVDLFTKRHRLNIQDRGSDVRMAFDQVERDREGQIDRLREEINKFREDQNIETLDVQNNEAAIDYRNVAAGVSELQLKLGSTQTYYAQLVQHQKSNILAPTPQDMAQAQANPIISSRTTRLMALRESLQLYRDRFGSNHRTVKSLKLTIQVIEREKQRMLDSVLRELQAARIAVARNAIQALALQLDGYLNHQAKAEIRLQDLMAKLTNYQAKQIELGQLMQSRQMVAEVVAEEQLRHRRPDVDRISWVLRATPAELTFPNFAIVSICTTVMVLGLTIGLVFLKERLDQRIKSPSDLSLLPGAELLGVLPQTEEDPSGPARIEGVVRKDPTGLMAEAFRQVRTAVMTRMDRRGYKTLMLCGAQAHCGVSAVINNLGLSLGYNGRKVAVLDGNFRRPVQHDLFGAALKPGLVEVLRGSSTLDQVIFHCEDPAVDVISTGAASDAPPELLETSEFRNLLIELEKRYDVVLIDAPPTLVASDSTLIAKHVDAVALVVRAMNEKRGLVGRLIGQMQDQRADLLGIILNGARSSAGGYFRQNYQAFYQYRQVDGQDRRIKQTTSTAAAL